MDRSGVSAVSVLFLVAGCSLVRGLAEESCTRCQSGPEEEHRLYGTKTTYSDAQRHINASPNVTIPGYCRPIMFYMFKRHAIRYPDGEDIPDMAAKLQSLKQLTLESHANGRSGLCADAIHGLRNWRINMKPEDDNLITSSGLKETAEIASRMHDQFPGLLDPELEFDVAISNRIRTNQTAFAFVQQLGQKTGKAVKFDPKVNLEWTDFHSICKRHLMEQGVALKKPALYEQFLKSEAMQTLLSSVSARLGLDSRISAADMKQLFRGCAFGHAIHNDSAWCAAFSKQELRLIEQLEDVDDFHGDSYGRDVNQKAPCPVIRDLMARIEDVVAQEETGERGKRTFLRFSHAGAMKQLISYLGLFDQLNMGLSSLSACEREKWDSRSREWRSSLISPFSANIEFILYKCTPSQNSGSGIDYRLLSLVQEAPVTVRGCATELCPLDQFLSHYRSANQCNLKKICRI